MVKVDVSRDYYADLELQPGASDTEVKKQFKKLALKYHPDRNPGRETEVNSKFQIINSAQEVLTNPDERAKYDAGRARGAATRAYSGFNTPAPSGTRGNPWANAGSQWAPPPRPPPPRESERRRPPPASAGAQRYSNFTTPSTAAPKAPPNAESMRENYQAWTNMRPPQPRAYQPQPPKPVPKEFTPQSGREESNSFKHAPPPKSTRPGFEEFRATSSRRNGFMPATPNAGDEPAASSTSAYSNYRPPQPSTSRPHGAPDPPPRTAPPADPLKHFRENAQAPYEPRLSTPYATHGGEKTDPFETMNINRSRSSRASPRTKTSYAETSSTRDRYRSASPPRSKNNRNMSPEPGIARADSEFDLGASPKRTFSTAAGRDSRESQSSGANASWMPKVSVDSASDSDNSDSETQDKSFGNRSRAYAKRRAAHLQSTLRDQDEQGPLKWPDSSTASKAQHPRKPSVAEFRTWCSSYEALNRNVLNDAVPDGSQKSADKKDPISKSSKKTEPSMYGSFPKFRNSSRPSIRGAETLPTVLEEPAPQSSAKVFPRCSARFAASSEACLSCSKLLGDLLPGVTHVAIAAHEPSFQTPPDALNAFESAQFALVDKLVKNSTSVAKPDKDESGSGIAEKTEYVTEGLMNFLTATMGSPIKRYRGDDISRSIIHSDDDESTNEMDCDDKRNADTSRANRFSYNAGDESFKSAHVPDGRFASGSAENITTKFTPEDWHGKFGAADYFANDKETRATSPTKTQQASKPQNGMKPPTMSIDPEFHEQSTDSDPPTTSPGGTKFTPEQWAKTFRPQNFAPPPFPSAASTARNNRTARRPKPGSPNKNPTVNKTVDTATAVSGDDGSNSAAQPPATAQNEAAGADSPTAMDIDSPPQSPGDHGKNEFSNSKNHENGARNVPVEPSRSDWRAGDSNNASASFHPAGQSHPFLPPRTRNANQSRRHTTRSADEEDFKTTLEDLNNIEPLHHPATGLKSFADLTSHLPFTSKAAVTIPLSRTIGTGKLNVPNPPRAPMLPPSGLLRPTPTHWESYLTVFKTYMAEWDIFNQKMILHFVARKNQVDLMKPGWLEAFGDTDLARYTEGMKEDVEVRETWSLACEKHMDAIERFRSFKALVREGRM